MYYYPRNLSQRPQIWHYSIPALLILSLLALLSVASLVRFGEALPAAVSGVLAVLLFRHEGRCPADFLRLCTVYLLFSRQTFSKDADGERNANE